MSKIKEIDLKKIVFPGESEELADLVNKYFFNKFAGKPKAAQAAHEAVMATGKFDEKYLEYLYMYWASQQNVQEAQRGPKASQQTDTQEETASV